MNSISRTSLFVSAFLISQFLVTVTIAMFLYDGGERFQESPEEYQFFGNTLSDLGRVRGFDGQQKALTRWLFTAALGLSGVGVAVFSFSAPGAFHSRRARHIMLAAVPFGLLSAAGFIGVGLIPADMNRTLHLYTTFFAFTPFLPVLILVMVAMRIDNALRKHISVLNTAFLLLLAAYLVLIYFGPTVRNPDGYEIQVLGQKIIVYAGIICLSLNGLFLARRIEISGRKSMEHFS